MLAGLADGSLRADRSAFMRGVSRREYSGDTHGLVFFLGMIS